MSVNATLPVTLSPGGAPKWLNTLRGLIASAGMQPRDSKFLTLWNLLRTCGLLDPSQWFKIRLRYFWARRGCTRARAHALTQRRHYAAAALGHSLTGAIFVGIRLCSRNVNVYVRGRARPHCPLRRVHVRRIGRVQPIARAVLEAPSKYIPCRHRTASSQRFNQFEPGCICASLTVWCCPGRRAAGWSSSLSIPGSEQMAAW